ncbi:MAG: class I SAM-dependent methyltransferase [Candidatus Omnitrophota bacterium]
MSSNNQYLKLLKEALAKRQSLRKTTNAIRLVNGAGDQLDGLILEQYDKHFVAQIFHPFWIKEAANLKDFLVDHFEVEYFIIKDRTKSASSKPEDIKFKAVFEKASSRCVVCENNIYFNVDLNNTLNTGLFLDMRLNRKLIGPSCKDKRVLNCFSYTCSFGLYARVFGAIEVVNVDISKKILEDGRRNYSLNNLVAKPQEFIKADAVSYLEKAIKKNNCFDVIILDPPSFARSEKGVFSVQKDLPRLMTMASGALNEGGKLFVSTNFSGLSHDKLEEFLKTSSQGRKANRITHLGQDIDFPGSGGMKESHLCALWVEY